MTKWHPRRLAKSTPIEALLRSRMHEERWPPSELHHEGEDSVLETAGRPPMIARWSRTSKSSPVGFSDNVDERFRELAKQTRDQGN